MKHIYIHVPFCARRCVYCDFAIAVRRQIPASGYVKAVLEEYDFRRSSGRWDEAALETIYLGGGTPSLLPVEQLSELIDHLRDAEASGASLREITLEANPENVNETAARAWVDAGVNRVSLGAQSFDDRILDWMHRTHDSGQTRSAVRALRVAGVDSVSLDLIIALPFELRHNVAGDLRQTLDLEPDHLSVYGLTVEPRTALARWVSRSAVIPAADADYERDFLVADEILTGAGYEHYEVSNYAKPGRRSLHNSAYWNGSKYAGLGPSAHSFDGMERRWNVAPWARYEREMNETGNPVEGMETLSSSQASLERLYLGLRVRDGIPSKEIGALDRNLVSRAEDAGWAVSTGSHWRLTVSGWLRLDEIVAALTASPKGG